MIGFIFISFFGETLPVQLVGQILCGIPWGVYQTVTTVYASEVLPLNLRGYLTSYVNLCWVIGQFIASGVLVGVQGRTDQWGWRIPFAVQVRSNGLRDASQRPHQFLWRFAMP
jgi:SP family general alpha glucoside:H+ symporter-like MFS transporter